MKQASETVCLCRAFPWPHAEMLSQKCWQQHYYDAGEVTVISETEQRRRQDYASRWREMR
jgi:hypothetical protein